MTQDTLRRIFDIADTPSLNLEKEIAEETMDTRLGGITYVKESDLLAVRQQTHGYFGDNARISQALKRTLRAEPGWELLTDTEKESMDMICLKFSRILSGKSMEKQHWEDVVGYAKLVEENCK